MGYPQKAARASLRSALMKSHDTTQPRLAVATSTPRQPTAWLPFTTPAGVHYDDMSRASVTGTFGLAGLLNENTCVSTF